ncbi:MAG: cell envelope integrity protein TolA [Polaromonas sp.]
MPSAADRLEFGPPRNAGSLRALALALLVHVLLIVALTWGISWKRSNPEATFQAELWSNMPPQEAAPRPVETPVPPPPPPTPTPVAPEAKVTPPAPDVDIALEQEKKRKLAQQKKELEAQQEKRQAELQAKKEREKEKEKLKELKAKEEQAKRKLLEDAKKAEAKKQDSKDAAQQKQTQAAAEKQRQENIRRIAGLAGATGSPDAKGTAQKASGGSTTYGAIVRAAIKPNVVFTEEIVGNPMAKVEVRVTLDGAIISQRLVQPSGNKAWDEAAINAIIRTRVMPRDIDGRIPDTTLILEMRPRN